MVRTAFRCAAPVFLSTCLGAEPASGWRTLNSVSKPPATMAGPVVRDGKCTIAVPGNWVDERTVDRSEAHSPDGRAKAFVQEFAASSNYPFLHRKNQTLTNYRNEKANTERVYQKNTIVLKVLELTELSQTHEDHCRNGQ